MAAPLADRIRPQSLDEMVGQQHLLGPNGLLRRIAQSGTLPNLIFYGPSGVGKTTAARIIAAGAGKKLYRLNGTTASTGDIKALIADLGGFDAMGGVVLYLDEIQYLNKKQQQTLLEYIEDGSITLIASTTENPYFYVYNAILSRCTVFEFKPVDAAEVERYLESAMEKLRQQSPELQVEEGALAHIAACCGGDVRKAANALEICALGAMATTGRPVITLEDAKQAAQRSAMRYDRDGDAHYDILSAFQKSMRGSDPDAALHYLARLLEAGDLASACRRLMVCACEDVGLAWPQIIPIVKAAVDAAMMVGLPEARIPLADAVILTATAPKSNSGESAIDAAMRDVKAGKLGVIPRTLQNVHYDGSDVAKKGQFYRYPHDYPDHWLDQQYLPDALLGASYYHYGDNKNEQAFKAYWENIKRKHSS